MTGQPEGQRGSREEGQAGAWEFIPRLSTRARPEKIISLSFEDADARADADAVLRDWSGEEVIVERYACEPLQGVLRRWHGVKLTIAPAFGEPVYLRDSEVVRISLANPPEQGSEAVPEVQCDTAPPLVTFSEGDDLSARVEVFQPLLERSVVIVDRVGRRTLGVCHTIANGLVVVATAGGDMVAIPLDSVAWVSWR